MSNAPFMLLFPVADPAAGAITPEPAAPGTSLLPEQQSPAAGAFAAALSQAADAIPGESAPVGEFAERLLNQIGAEPGMTIDGRILIATGEAGGVLPEGALLQNGLAPGAIVTAEAIAAAFATVPPELEQNGAFLLLDFVPGGANGTETAQPTAILLPLDTLGTSPLNGSPAEAFLIFEGEDGLHLQMSGDLGGKQNSFLLPVKLNLAESNATALLRAITDWTGSGPSVSTDPVLQQAPPSSSIVSQSLQQMTAQFQGQFEGLQLESLEAHAEIDVDKLGRWLLTSRNGAETAGADSKPATPVSQQSPIGLTRLLEPTAEQRPAPVATVTGSAGSTASMDMSKAVSGLENIHRPESTILPQSESAAASAVVGQTGDLSSELGGGSLFGGQNQESAPGSAATPPLQSQQAFSLPEPSRFQLEFSRLQAESLLKRGEIRLKLRPPELGNVRIELTSTSEQVSARFEIASEAARRVVEYHLPQLRENLARAGVQVDQVEVVVTGDPEKRQQASSEQRRWQPPTSQNDDESETELSSASPSFLTTAGRLNLVA